MSRSDLADLRHWLDFDILTIAVRRYKKPGRMSLRSSDHLGGPGRHRLDRDRHRGPLLQKTLEIKAQIAIDQVQMRCKSLIMQASSYNDYYVKLQRKSLIEIPSH